MNRALAFALACTFSLAALAQEGEKPKEKAPEPEKKAPDAKDEVKVAAKKTPPAKTPFTRFSGTLSASDPKVVRSDCHQQVHTIRLTAGQTYHIRMNRLGAILGGVRMDAYLVVQNASGLEVAKDDDSGGDNNSLLAYTPPADGDFKLIATTFGPGQTGPYEVTVTPMPLGTPPPSIFMGGPTVVPPPVASAFLGVTEHSAPLTIDPKTKIGTMTQSLNLSGSRVYVMTASTKDAGDRPASLRVEDAKGAVVAEPGRDGTDARLTFSPKTGPYRLVLTMRDASGLKPGASASITLSELYASAKDPPPQAHAIDASVASPAGERYGDVVVTPLPRSDTARLDLPGTKHGYAEYRFRIENRSKEKAHRVTLTLPQHHGGQAWGRSLESLTKTVEVGPEGATQVSLFQPYLRFGVSNSAASVAIDGATQEQMLSVELLQNRGPNLGGVHYGVGVRPAGAMALPERAHVLVGGVAMATEVQQHAYKLLVADSTEEDVRTARIYWAPGTPHHGKLYNATLGTLRAFAANGPVAEWSREWLGYGQYDAVVVSGRELDEAPSEVQAALRQYVECGGVLASDGPTKLVAGWKKEASTAADCDRYEPGFGRCLVFRSSPSTWSLEGWGEFGGAAVRAAQAWTQMSNATGAHGAFPVVDNVAIPVRSLLGFLFVFVVLIGPLNVYWLAKSNRRIWLLWTVPVFSLLTSGLLFGFLALTEGWRPHVRSTLVTYLDENSQRAATVGWIGYFSPSTSSDGLRFDLDVELSSHAHDGGVPHHHMMFHPAHRRQMTAGAQIDWTERQHLGRGWIVAKTPLHFCVRRNEKRLERVTVRREGERLMAVNGLKAELTTLTVCDADGTLFEGKAIRPGAEIALTAAGKASPTKNGATGFGGPWLSFANDLRDRPQEYLRPGMYVATTSESPFLASGVSNAQSTQTTSVVVGRLKDAP